MNRVLLGIAFFALCLLAFAGGKNNKPLDLKFQAVDGTQVNLASMRGKVVLIDFWATWCPPCREEVGDVVSVYNRYHDEGFEVVGISLDNNKNDLVNFTAEHNMTWPQYFDGKGWDNALAKKFHIHSIPTMWLVGKDGKIVSENARDDLDGAVQSALHQM